MGIKGGPRIPKDGLVLSLDAANSKSFRGEPTTNLTRNARDFTGNAYASINEYYSSVLNKTYISDLDTPVGKGATLISVNGSYGYHALSRWGGSETANYYLSCYVKPIDSGITDFTLGLVGDSGNRATFNLDTKQVTIANGLVNQDAFIKEVEGWPGWLRIGADIEGRAGGWVGSIGYSQWFQYTGSDGYGSLYITGIQFETGSFTHFIDAQQTRGTTVATGGGWSDITNNSNHGELINGTTYDSGSLGVLSFDGVNDYIDLDITNGINQLNGADVTICAFVKPDNVSSLATIFTTRGNNNNELFFGFYDSKLIFGRYPPSGDSPDSGLYPSAGEWNFVAVSAIHASSATFCLNGEFSTISHTETYTGGTPTKVTIGAQVNNDASSGVVSRFYNGKIANMMVYNRALTAEEIKNIYAATRGRFGL